MNRKFYKSKEWLKNEYCCKRRLVKDIAKECGVSTSSIFIWIRKYNIKCEHLPPIRLAHRYKVDVNYFEKIDSDEKAYWLGFIAADGYVTNKKGRKILGIDLARKDEEHLKKIRMAIGYEGPLYYREVKTNKIKNGLARKVSLRISCQKIVEDLMKLGIIPKKSKVLKRPTIDKEYYRSWIRGVFDGDGHISKHKDGRISGGFFGTYDVIKFIVENIPGTNTVSARKDGSGYYHSFGGKYRINEIFEYLYSDTKVYLERKKLIFDLNRRKVGA